MKKKKKIAGILSLSKRLTKLSDRELGNLIANGSPSEAEAAFTVFYERYSVKVHAYCYRIISNRQDAEDVFQETFIRFHKWVSVGGVKSNVTGFLFTIARNLSINQTRRYRRWEFEEVGEEELLRSDFPYENKELLELIKASLELIHEEYRDVFILREYNGLSYNEIAEILDTTASAAKIRAFRARAAIRKILEPYLKDIISI